MLTEIHDVQQVRGEDHRRWFEDDWFDLVVWHDGPVITGFQLCYDLGGDERALTWRSDGGYLHTGVDEGDNPGGLKRSPILVADGMFRRDEIAGRFKRAAAQIDRTVADFVHRALLACPL